MSSISAPNPEDARPRHEMRLDGSDAVFGPQHLADAEKHLRVQDVVKAEETTVFNAAYTGKGSIINDMA
ncbi:hypothetical protein [Paucidesulfovibrio longus]|uniref:hypothetical protein n=1 Tax=Paucidesulfovibrio longus TaxID=889 RepID=UPI0003B5715A|nr:hypothetical protein [Paucidesulfovibrio longus]